MLATATNTDRFSPTVVRQTQPPSSPAPSVAVGWEGAPGAIGAGYRRWDHATAMVGSVLFSFGGFGTQGASHARCNDLQRLDMATAAVRDEGWVTLTAAAEDSRPPKPRVSSSMVTTRLAGGGGFGGGFGGGGGDDMGSARSPPNLTQQTLVIFGGRAAPQRPLNDTFLFSLADQTWNLLDTGVAGDAPAPRWRHSATVLRVPDLGDVMLVLGGRNATAVVVDDGCTGFGLWGFDFLLSPSGLASGSASPFVSPPPTLATRPCALPSTRLAFASRKGRGGIYMCCLA